MLSKSYYAQNNAGIIGLGLVTWVNKCFQMSSFLSRMEWVDGRNGWVELNIDLIREIHTYITLSLKLIYE